MSGVHNHQMQTKLEGHTFVGCLLVTLHNVEAKIESLVCTMVSFMIIWVTKKKRHYTNQFQTISPSIFKLPRNYVMRLESQGNQLGIIFKPKMMSPFAMNNLNSDIAPIYSALRALVLYLLQSNQVCQQTCF